MAEMGLQKRSILCVGLVVVDVVTAVDKYPIEDTKSRCSNVEEHVGGNAATNCRVLSLLGEAASFMGCVGTTPHHLQLVKDMFDRYNVDYSPMILWDGHPMPISICLLNKSSGSRTCLHYRGSIPELFYEDFIKADLKLNTYKWIHFEGRYEYHDTKRQIAYISDIKHRDGYSYKLSVELEKASDTLIPLLSCDADYIFVSRDFAMLMGYGDMKSAAVGLSSQVNQGVTVICPWGSCGVAAKLNGSDQVVTSNAYKPDEVVNTLGAGDTFIAACIKSLSNGQSLDTSLNFACRVAGTKCGVKSLDELAMWDFS